MDNIPKTATKQETKQHSTGKKRSFKEAHKRHASYGGGIATTAFPQEFNNSPTAGKRAKNDYYNWELYFVL